MSAEGLRPQVADEREVAALLAQLAQSRAKIERMRAAGWAAK